MQLVADAEEASIWVDLQHVALVLGLIVSFFVIVAGIRTWKKEHKATLVAREEAIAARLKQEELLNQVALEFQNNHGSSMLDKIEEIGRSLNSHCEVAETHFKNQSDGLHELKKDNQDQHDAIHRRIDGMFELFVGGNATTPRKTAQRHLNREERNES